MSRTLAPNLSAELPGGGRVLFTDRAQGNVSSVGGLGHEQGHEARERLRREIGVSALVRSHQVHGTVVRHIEQAGPEDELPQADGQATTTRGLGMMVLSADCLPVALGCEGAVAMVHAGWRGLAAGVLEQGVRALRDAVGASAEQAIEIVAVIGPGAGPCCYEVGQEVHDAFGDRGRGAHLEVEPASHAAPGDQGRRAHLEVAPEPHAAFGDWDRGTANIDLRAIARSRLLAAGVRRVEELGGCTICDERFFSYRREGAAAGRSAGVAWLS